MTERTKDEILYYISVIGFLFQVNFHKFTNSYRTYVFYLPAILSYAWKTKLL